MFSKENLMTAAKQVASNKGCKGIDGMYANEIVEYIDRKYDDIFKGLNIEAYNPQEVLLCRIPKGNGKVRILGIGTVLDRAIQRCISNTLYPIFEVEMLDNSFGFRKDRNAIQAAQKAIEYANQGHTWVVDLDLENFFNEMNHEIVLNLVKVKINDEKILRLIRKYLQVFYLDKGKRIRCRKGSPQGSNLSPLLSNIMLNELDHVLMERKHKFIRYADDFSIYVKSKKSAERVFKSITRYIEKELRLKVNREKSSIKYIAEFHTLGFKFYNRSDINSLSVSNSRIEKLKEEISNELNNKDYAEANLKISQIITGWIEYYKFADISRKTKMLDEWIRREAIKKIKRDRLPKTVLDEVKLISAHEQYSKVKRH
jgi:group II intron reverse transcriptase/maturase